MKNLNNQKVVEAIQFELPITSERKFDVTLELIRELDGTFTMVANVEENGRCIVTFPVGKKYTERGVERKADQLIKMLIDIDEIKSAGWEKKDISEMILNLDDMVLGLDDEEEKNNMGSTEEQEKNLDELSQTDEKDLESPENKLEENKMLFAQVIGQDVGKAFESMGEAVKQYGTEKNIFPVLYPTQWLSLPKKDKQLMDTEKKRLVRIGEEFKECYVMGIDVSYPQENPKQYI